MEIIFRMVLPRPERYKSTLDVIIPIDNGVDGKVLEVAVFQPFSHVFLFGGLVRRFTSSTSKMARGTARSLTERSDGIFDMMNEQFNP